MALITPEQRKGLIYGAILSSGIGALAALGTGGNWNDAMLAGTAGLSSGYAGGLDKIVQFKKAELDNERVQELMKAQKEATRLAGERFGLQKETSGITNKLRTRQTEALEQKTAEEGRANEALQAVMGSSGLTPTEKTMVGATPLAQRGGLLQQIISSHKPKVYPPEEYINEQGGRIWRRPGESVPMGYKSRKEVIAASQPLVLPLSNVLQTISKEEAAKGKTFKTGVSPNVKAQVGAAEAKQPAGIEQYIDIDTGEMMMVNSKDPASVKKLNELKPDGTKPRWRKYKDLPGYMKILIEAEKMDQGIQEEDLGSKPGGFFGQNPDNPLGLKRKRK